MCSEHRSLHPAVPGCPIGQISRHPPHRTGKCVALDQRVDLRRVHDQAGQVQHLLRASPGGDGHEVSLAAVREHEVQRQITLTGQAVAVFDRGLVEVQGGTIDTNEAVFDDRVERQLVADVPSSGRLVELLEVSREAGFVVAPGIHGTSGNDDLLGEVRFTEAAHLRVVGHVHDESHAGFFFIAPTPELVVAEHLAELLTGQDVTGAELVLGLRS